MPAHITLDGLSYRTPDGRLLFDNLTLAFGTERTGLVGRNGVGKSTLLRLIAGELEPSAGSVARHGRIAVLRQAVARPPGATLADLLGVADGLARLKRIEAGRAGEDDLAEADWGLEARLAFALAAMGLSDLDLARPAARLSGGEATRAALAGLLVPDPDVLLLDEPTNNLDTEGRDLVADLLETWRGGAIVVSHDRAVLRRMDRIVELSSLGAKVYGGNYDLYLERKAAEEAAASRELGEAEASVTRAARENQQARERKARRDAAGRRFAAKRSEPKMLLDARAERAEASGGKANRLAGRKTDEAARELAEARAKVERLRHLSFDLPPTGLSPGRPVLAFEDVAFAYADETLALDGLTFRMAGPERVALTGLNGAGKSTAVRIATGALQPSRGQVRAGVDAALLDQDVSMLREDETLTEAFLRLNPEANSNLARAALARFLFRNVAADKRVRDLSGGERLRAALACVLNASRPPQLLVLDEPTNHLDLESIEAVEAALRGYDGALLVVSHDRDFLAAIEIEREIELPARRACSV